MRSNLSLKMYSLINQRLSLGKLHADCGGELSVPGGLKSVSKLLRRLVGGQPGGGEGDDAPLIEVELSECGFESLRELSRIELVRCSRLRRG